MVRAIRADVKMNWTNERPTQRGWYWFRGTPGLPLGQYDGILQIDNSGQAQLNGKAGWWPFERFEGQWAGPVEQPK